MEKYNIALLVSDVNKLSFLNNYLLSKIHSDSRLNIILISKIKTHKSSIFSRINKKFKFWGVFYLVEYFLTYPVRFFYFKYQFYKIEKELLLNFDHKQLEVSKFCGSDNEVVNFLKNNSFNLIIQAGYGILNSSLIKSCNSLIINLHHGVASEIRGVDSLMWAFYFRNSNMLGGTIHEIDEGIDTGRILKYIYPINSDINSKFYQVYVEITQIAFDEIKNIIDYVISENDLSFSQNSKGLYKSSISGYRVLKVLIRNL
jgi:folate-dependent phosphoribosylglycinamide formyltransferase PurN